MSAIDLDQLNDQQLKAVTYMEPGPVMVIAGPGSGKTFTITKRIQFLIHQLHIPPHKILVLTFTKDAAKAMETRFHTLESVHQPVCFGTFHSFFYSILKKSNSIKNIKNLNYKEKEKLLTPIIKEFLYADTRAAYHIQQSVQAYIQAISFYKNTQNITETLNKLSHEEGEKFLQVFEKYEERRKAECFMDYDDVLTDCLELLRNSDQACKYWQNYFQFILLDEFQDINPVQYEVMRMLFREPYSIFAVGDDDQSIYGFRGSMPAILKEFADAYMPEKVELGKNYRSSQAIVESASKVIAENKQRFVKNLSAVNKDTEEEAFLYKGFVSAEEMNQYLLENLQSKKTVEIAVLFRTNKHLQKFAYFLRRNNVPYQLKEKMLGIYDQDIVQDMMSYLKLIKGLGLQKDFLRIINRPERGINREAIREYLPGQAEAFMPIDEGGPPLLLELQKLYDKPIYLCLVYIRKKLGYDRYIETHICDEEGRKEAYEMLDWLGREAHKYKELQAWLSIQKEEPIPFKKNDDCHLSLMTVHASKGLEFEQVYIPHCNEHVYPYGNIIESEEVLEEERRIFYVAMTRAKKHLELLYVTGTKDNPRYPSRFMNPLRQ